MSKLCKDCIHYRHLLTIAGSMYNTKHMGDNICGRPSVESKPRDELVTGRVLKDSVGSTSAQNERQPHTMWERFRKVDKCGPEGKYYEFNEDNPFRDL